MYEICSKLTIKTPERRASKKCYEGLSRGDLVWENGVKSFSSTGLVDKRLIDFLNFNFSKYNKRLGV